MNLFPVTVVLGSPLGENFVAYSPAPGKTNIAHSNDAQQHGYTTLPTLTKKEEAHNTFHFNWLPDTLSIKVNPIVIANVRPRLSQVA